jgi:hypothetical protein
MRRVRCGSRAQRRSIDRSARSWSQVWLRLLALCPAHVQSMIWLGDFGLA